MHIRVSSPGNKLDDGDVDRIERDLQKIDRRLKSFDEVYAEIRIQKADGAPTSFSATLEVEYSKNHLVAKATNTDMGQAVREAREEILRQINDRSRGSHSQYSKGR